MSRVTSLDRQRQDRNSPPRSGLVASTAIRIAFRESSDGQPLHHPSPMSLDVADADAEIELRCACWDTRCEGLEHRPFARAQGRNQPRRLGGITLACSDRVFLLPARISIP